METIDNTLKTAEQEIDRLSKTSPTVAGQDKTSTRNAESREELVDCINQIFSLFRVNYHNQFYAAFNDSETLNQAKRMWLNASSLYNTETLLQSTRKIIEESEYLPTLNRFLDECDQFQFTLPSSHPQVARTLARAASQMRAARLALLGHAFPFLEQYHPRE
jgi:hypothetical protein